MEVRIIGNMDNTIDHTFESANRVYDKDGLCPTIPTCGGGNIQPKIIEKQQLCVAMRGRGMDNKQTLELNTTSCTNALTTVQKDNLVIEQTKCVGGLSANKWGNQYHQQDRVYKGDIALAQPANIPEGSYKYLVSEVKIKQATKEGTIKCKVGGCYDASYPNSKTRRGRVQNDGDVVPTITASNSENINVIETVYRIRKLTPRECWRLMGYTDEDFDKAQTAGVSNSQLYKQAGNAIVKQVLMAIFSQLIY